MGRVVAGIASMLVCRRRPALSIRDIALLDPRLVAFEVLVEDAEGWIETKGFENILACMEPNAIDVAMQRRENDEKAQSLTMWSSCVYYSRVEV